MLEALDSFDIFNFIFIHMSRIKNVRSKMRSYSVVLQIFFRLEKFIQYSKSQQDKEMYLFNQINDKYLESFSSNLRNQNFMSK